MKNLYVVATPIGNLSDFSARAIDTLNMCDVVLAEDTRQTIKLLNHFNIKKKMISYHKYNELKRTEEIFNNLLEYDNIALVSDAGTPCISDPGYILVKSALEHNVNVYGISGCSAVITALSTCGLDTSSFAFYGFVPTDNKPRKEYFDKIKYSNVNLKVLYESPKRILKLMKDIKSNFSECSVCVVRELTKVYEKRFYGKIDDVINKMNEDKNVLKGEYVVIIESKNEVMEKESNSLEALIINEMINGISLKDAVNIVNEKNKDINKKDIYNAGLRLKELFNNK